MKCGCSLFIQLSVAEGKKTTETRAKREEKKKMLKVEEREQWQSGFVHQLNEFFLRFLWFQKTTSDFNSSDDDLVKIFWELFSGRRKGKRS